MSFFAITQEEGQTTDVLLVGLDQNQLLVVVAVSPEESPMKNVEPVLGERSLFVVPQTEEVIGDRREPLPEEMCLSVPAGTTSIVDPNPVAVLEEFDELLKA
jgi:hypothetical protein